MSANFCPDCGAPLEPGAHFCQDCGHQVGSAGAAAAAGAAGTEPPTQPQAAVPPSAAAPAAAAGVGAATTYPAAPPEKDRRGLWVGVGVLVVIAVIAAVIAAVVLADDEEAGAEVWLEPTAVDVPDPFTDNVAGAETPIDPTATTAPVSTTAAVSPGAGGGTVTGSAAGLYGGSLDSSSCDVERLIAFLQNEPSKAAAWAGVAGIAVEEVPAYVRGLTPVVLRWDTRVLNHGYEDGEATPRAAVLQAGTAVLVDRFGVPRVKCYCGNPLGAAPPVTTRTTYTGSRWASFDRTRIVVVRADEPVDTFILVNLSDGTPFGRPAGTSGGEDTSLATTTTAATTSVPPATRAPTTGAPATSPPAGPDRSQEAIDVVAGSLCHGGFEDDYITSYEATELAVDLYLVEVLIELDSGSWVARFEVDFASEFPQVRPLDTDSASMLC